MSIEFESMTATQVYRRTASEGAVQRGKPLYAGRSWTQLHEEMIEYGARTVGDLPPERIVALRAATEAQATTPRAGTG